MQGRCSFFLNRNHSPIKRKMLESWQNPTNLHSIHVHLHIEFKGLYLQVCKINCVICCNCVPIQSPGHCTNEIHNMFKNHIPEDERCQSAKGSCTLVILIREQRVVWLEYKTGKATALKFLTYQGSLLRWVLDP